MLRDYIVIEDKLFKFITFLETVDEMCKDKGSKRHFNIAARLSLNEFYVHISLKPMVGCAELSF